MYGEPAKDVGAMPVRTQVDRALRSGEAASGGTAFAEVAKLRQAEEQYLASLQETLQATVGLENRSLHDFMGRPSVRAALKEAADAAAETGSYFPHQAGQEFTVANLQRIKKALADQLSKKSLTSELGPTQKAEITGTLSQFTGWLSNKSPAWKAARLQYAEDSVPINRMQIGQKLEDALRSPTDTERAGAFATAMRNEAKTIKSASGKQIYTKLEDALDPNQMKSLRDVETSLATLAEHRRLASAGGDSTRRTMEEMVKVPHSTGIFMPSVTVIRMMLNRLEGRAQTSHMKELASLMRSDPQALANAMEAAQTPAQRRMISHAMLIPERFLTSQPSREIGK